MDNRLSRGELISVMSFTPTSVFLFTLLRALFSFQSWFRRRKPWKQIQVKTDYLQCALFGNNGEFLFRSTDKSTLILRNAYFFWSAILKCPRSCKQWKMRSWARRHQLLCFVVIFRFQVASNQQNASANKWWCFFSSLYKCVVDLRRLRFYLSVKYNGRKQTTITQNWPKREKEDTASVVLMLSS